MTSAWTRSGAGLLLAAVVLSCATLKPEPAAVPDPPGVQVVLLGTGTPNAEPDRAGSALAVVVGEVAAAAGVGAVVLTHQLLWGASEGDLVAEVHAGYDGPVFFGRDLDVFSVRDGVVARLP